jgi:flagellar biogenesis protein FliO
MHQRLVIGMTDGPPAGGATTEEVVVAGIVGVLFAALAFVLMVVRRRGRIGSVDRLAGRLGGVMRLPGWAAVPLAVAGISLIVAVVGFYWDVATHIDHGRDESVFGNPAHWPILVGLVGIAVAGMLSLLLGTDEARPGSVQFRHGWHVPIGGVLLVVCGLVALAGFPIDDVWHRIFGQDVTLWSPPHIQMVAGASLCTIALWVLHVEAERADPQRLGARRHHWNEVAIAGSVLIGMSTLQGEFDFGVPQFNLLFQPLLIAIAAGIALVPARVRLGPWGAVKAVIFFLVLRGLITLLVTGAFDHLPFLLPLYLGSAVVVELLALVVSPRRQLTFGALAGLGIGTVGLAAEALWVNAIYPITWTTALLPEAVLLVVPAALAAGLVGGFLARALVPSDAPRQEVPRALAPLAALVLAGALAFPLPRGEVEGTAELTLEDAGPGEAHITVQLDPPDLAEDARWFQSISWQGASWWSDDHTRIDDLEALGDGRYRTVTPVPVHGSWKTMLRLHDGRTLAAVPVFLPEDRAIPAEEVPAEPQATRDFIPDEEILLREQRPAPAWIDLAGHLGMLVIAIAWVAVFVWATRRLRLAEPRVEQVIRLDDDRVEARR